MSRVRPATAAHLGALPNAGAVGLAAALVAGLVGALLGRGEVHAAWLLAGTALVVAVGLGLTLRWAGPGLAGRALPGGRRAHSHMIPQIGGWAVGPALLAALVLGLPENGVVLAIGAGLVWFVGVLDDVHGVRARTKLVAQVVGALIVVLGGLDLHQVGAPGLGVGIVELGAWGDVLLFFWIVGVTNAFNLVDGLDGLLGMLTLVALLGLASGGVPVLPLAVWAGAVLGVLAFNLPRARVYFGDSGSMLMGFTLAALVAYLPHDKNVPLALGLMAVPLLDMALALARRWVRGIPLSAADLGHLHHRMYEMTGGRRAVALLALTGLALVPLALSLWRPGLASLASTTALGGLVVLGVMRLGRARLSRAIQGRARWQRLYLLEAYVAGLLRLARSQDEVRRAMRRLVEDLPLAGLAGPLLAVGRPIERGDSTYDVPLQDEAAAKWWCHDESPPPESLALARETVVCELVRLAVRRLAELEGDVLPAAGAGAPVELTTPDPVPAAASARPQGT
ncbi:MAG: undecaprenyl/decaprenyl-phosphate alpha-N-acetylglucosaminyl 1-phosphate transferase [Planctomycetes bacterium]|nr:undecaprenyl/decaprenyl-phosphate alpha-N-acetylglucosaminyl 1-phosphate transferase [Planctomycetota bacterium]